MNSSESNREPSTVYLTISFVLLGIMQTVSIVCSSILIFTIGLHRHLRTIPNLLTANSSVAIWIYAWLMIAQIIIGFQPIYIRRGSVCLLLSYLTCIAADAICYSYLVTAISQYFFNILYRRKYLLTFSVHWFIILLSWCISCLLPLLLYLQGILQYSSELHMCSLKMSVQWAVFIYMGTAIGIPFFGIIAIYHYIVRSTRRVNTIVVAVLNSTRDLHVLRNILTLVGILGTAGFPTMILVIWNAVFADGAPVPLYLFCALMISFCTNIQISFIFFMSKNVRTVLWNYVQRLFH